MTEKNLVKKFIENPHRGIIRISEVPVYGRSIDVCEFDGKYVTIIEFKLHDWRKALLQLNQTMTVSDFNYICMVKPKTFKCIETIKNEFRKYGFGVIFYDGVFVVHLDSIRNKKIWRSEKNRLVKRMKEMEKNNGR